MRKIEGYSSLTLSIFFSYYEFEHLLEPVCGAGHSIVSMRGRSLMEFIPLKIKDQKIIVHMIDILKKWMIWEIQCW